MYLRKDLKAFAVLSAILVALAVLGLRDWNRAAAASKYGVQLTLEDG
jgi:hypothetical protein